MTASVLVTPCLWDSWTSGWMSDTVCFLYHMTGIQAIKNDKYSLKKTLEFRQPVQLVWLLSYQILVVTLLRNAWLPSYVYYASKHVLVSLQSNWNFWQNRPTSPSNWIVGPATWPRNWSAVYDNDAKLKETDMWPQRHPDSPKIEWLPMCNFLKNMALQPNYVNYFPEA